MQLLLNDVVTYHGDAWKFTALENKGNNYICAMFTNMHKSPLRGAYEWRVTTRLVEKLIENGEMECLNSWSNAETEPGKVSSSTNTKKRAK
jgi:hypothetical protein